MWTEDFVCCLVLLGVGVEFELGFEKSQSSSEGGTRFACVARVECSVGR